MREIGLLRVIFTQASLATTPDSVSRNPSEEIDLSFCADNFSTLCRPALPLTTSFLSGPVKLRS